MFETVQEVKLRTRFPVTAHIFLLREGKVLLLRRFNTGFEDGNFSVVAGHLDGNETVRQAAMREAREEVGIRLDPQDLEVIGVMQRRSDEERIDFFLASHSWQGEPSNCEPNKCDDLMWAAPDHLPPNTIPYIRQALMNFQSGNWYSEFGWE
jgi:8-oxo-dGTP diphosphatase